MKGNIMGFLRKCQHLAVLALGSIPILVLIVMNTVPGALWRAVLLDGLYLALACGCLAVPGKRRVLCGLLGAGILAGAGLALLPLGESLVLALLIVMYVLLLFLSLPVAGWPREREVGTVWICIGAVANVLLQLLINGARMAGRDTYKPAETLLLLAFLGFLALVLLAFNRASMESAGQSRRSVPQYMRRINVALTIALLVLSVLVAAIPAIGSLLGDAWDLLVQAVMWLAAVIMAFLPEKTGGQSGAAPVQSDSFSLGETNEPSQLALILEKVIGVVALAALVILVCLLLRKILQKLRVLVAWLLRRLNEYGMAAGEDYEDEITDTRGDAEHEGRGLFLRRRSRIPRRDESAMTPAERIRYRYLRLKARREDWSKAQTARETLPVEAARLYEQARYSGQPLTDEQASAFREKTKQL